VSFSSAKSRTFRQIFAPAPATQLVNLKTCSCNNPLCFSLSKQRGNFAVRGNHLKHSNSERDWCAMENLLNEAIKVSFSWQMLTLTVFSIAGLWRIYEKAGERGWACLVPIYNVDVWVRIAGARRWYFLLYFVPLVGVVVHILVTRDVAKRFGKSALFGLGLCLAAPVFNPILGFGRAQYQKAAYGS
jgi:Family of unknown function (DUF5684)